MQLGDTSALGTGGLTVVEGTVDLNGTSPNALPFLAGSGGTITDDSTWSWPTTLTVNQSSGDTNFGGSIKTGSNNRAIDLVKNGSSNLTLSGGNTVADVTVYAGQLTVNGSLTAAGGAMVTGAATLEEDGSLTATGLNFYGSATFAGDGNITLTGDGPYSYYGSPDGLYYDSNAASTFTGPITTTTTTADLKVGAGDLTLSGNENRRRGRGGVQRAVDAHRHELRRSWPGVFSPSTVVISGSLSTPGNTTLNADGNDSSVLHVLSGGNLYTVAVTASDASQLTVDGTLTVADGVNICDHATLAGSGDITLMNSGNLYYPSDGSSTFAGSIGGSGGIDLAGGRLTLSGVSNYAGDTVVEGGTLQVGTDNALPFGSSAGNLTVKINNGTGTLDLAGHTLNVNGLSGDGLIDDSTGNGTLVVGNDDATSAFWGQIENSGGTLALTKVGSGTLTLYGADTLGGGLSTDTLGGGLSVDGSGTLDIAASLTTEGAAAYVNDSCTLDVLWGCNLATGSLTSNQTSGLGVNGSLSTAALNVFGSSTLAGSGTITLTSANLYYLSSSVSTFAGSIGGTTSSSGLDLAGGQLTLSGNDIYSGSNTYSGDTLVYGPGVLRIGADNALPYGPGKGNVGIYATGGGAVPATLDMAGCTVNVNGFEGNGTIDDSTGSGTLLVGNNDASTIIDGTIQNSGGTLSLVKVGSGTLTLSGSNSYGGGTEIDSGTLRLDDPAALGTGGLTVNGGTVDLNGNNLTLGNSNALLFLAGSGGVITDSSTAGTTTLTVNQSSGDTTFGGSIQTGAQGTTIALQKRGGSNLTLSGANTLASGLSVFDSGAGYHRKPHDHRRRRLDQRVEHARCRFGRQPDDGQPDGGRPVGLQRLRAGR